jgi:type VI protein secretion system component Hcp
LKFAFGAITEANSTSSQSWSRVSTSDDGSAIPIPSLPPGLTPSPLPAPAKTSLTLQLAGGTALAATIHLSTFQFGFHNTITVSPGFGDGWGTTSFNDLDVTAVLSDASPDLFKTLATGTHYGTATLTENNASGLPIAVWILSNIFVDDDVVTASGGSNLPTEEFKFAFGAITEANSTDTQSWSQQTIDGHTLGIPSLPGGLTLSPLLVPSKGSLTLQLARGTATPATIVLDTFQLGFHNSVAVGSPTPDAGAGTASVDALDVTTTLSNASPDLFSSVAARIHYTTATLTENDALGQPIAVWVLGFVFVTDDALTASGGGSNLPTEELKFVFNTITEANSTDKQSWSQQANSDSDPLIPRLPSGLTLSRLPAPANTSVTLQLAGGDAPAATIILNTFQFGFDDPVTILKGTSSTVSGLISFDALDVTANLSNASPDLFEALVSGISYDTATLTENNASGQPIAVWVLGNVSITNDAVTGTRGASGLPVEELKFVFAAITEANNTYTDSWSRVTQQDTGSDIPRLPPGLPLSSPSAPTRPGLTLQLAGGDAPVATAAINLNTFQFGFHNTVTISSATGIATAGTPTFDPLDVTIALNTFSPDLFRTLTGGTHYDTATLTENDALGHPVAVWVLHTAYITDDVLTDTDGGSGLPVEELKFGFGDITEVTNATQASWSFTNQSATGPQAPNSASLAPLASFSPTITVSAGPFTYDGRSHAATATATGVGGDTVSGSFTFRYATGTSVSGTASSTAPTLAGTYTVVAHFASGDPNYASADSVPLTFSIAQAKLTVTADNQTKIQGEANPAFTASYSGFVPGQGPGDLGGALTFSTSATAGSLPGTYAITPGGLASTNYAITFVSGTLTVLSFAQATANLEAQVDAAGLPHGMQHSLDRKLEAAIDAFNRGKTTAGVHHLEAFIHHVSAQSGKHIDDGLADTLIAAADRIAGAIDSVDAAGTGSHRDRCLGRRDERGEDEGEAT